MHYLTIILFTHLLFVTNLLFFALSVASEVFQKKLAHEHQENLPKKGSNETQLSILAHAAVNIL